MRVKDMSDDVCDVMDSRAGNRSFAPLPDYANRLILDRLPDTVLVIPDLQAPFHHPDTLSFLSMVNTLYSPDCVVSIGDEVDLGWLSKYDKYPEVDNPAAELRAARDFMSDLFRLFPRGYGLTSNHAHGRLATARKAGRLLPEMICSFDVLVGAPKGWAWYEEVRLGNVMFRHGDKWSKLNKSQLVEQTLRHYGKPYSLVHGHLHEQHGVVASVLIGDDEVWAGYTGCLIDPRSKAFDYTKAARVRLGCVCVVKGVLHRIPMRLDEQGRWTGKLS